MSLLELPALWDRLNVAALKAKLLSERSVLSIAVLRVAFGGFVMWQAYHKGARIFASSRGEVFNFTYSYFDWVTGSSEYASVLAAVWFISGLMFSLGLFFRVSGPLCFLMSAYSFLISAELYLNHEYMELIFLLLLSFGPANCRLSIDSYIWKYSTTAPYYYLLALKLQTEIILIYAGVVKVNNDWLHLQPLSNWLLQRTNLVFFGALWESSWSVAIGAYGIIVLHCFGAPLMFWKRTRIPVFCLYSAFHVINSQIFPIDIFPWMTIACSTLFFDPDWPSNIVRWVLDIFGESNKLKDRSEPAPTIISANSTFSLGNSILAIFLAVWLVFQTLIPLRHLMYPGWVDWTSEGTRFSWRMMLSQRNCPVELFILYDPKSEEIFIPNLRKLMSFKMYNAACIYSDTTLQAARQVREYYIHYLGLSSDTEVHAYMMKSLNYRRPTLYIDPKVDLEKVPRQIFRHDSWILSDAELEPLPPPFSTNEKDFNRPSALQMAAAAGINVKIGYTCSYQPTPNTYGATDVHCTRN